MTSHERDVVEREYESETRFLARRLAAQATLRGPIVEDATIDVLRTLAPRRILEVGCGTGDYTARVQAELGVEMIALDQSPRMVELTRARGIDARTGDIEALAFDDASFDCVLANRVLYHVTNLDRGLTEIARVLRNGAALVAVTYSDDHLGEYWDVVGRAPRPSTFSSENGEVALCRHFGHVARADLSGSATFASHDVMFALAESFGEFAWYSLPEAKAKLATLAVPFEATYRHTVFTATRTTP